MLKESDCLIKINLGKNSFISNFNNLKNINEAKEIFNSWVDVNFYRFKIEEPVIRKNKFKIDGYEIISDVSFDQALSSFSVDFDKLCFSEKQIVSFCKNNLKNLETDGFITFFLVKISVIGYAMAAVIKSSSGMTAGLLRIKTENIYLGGSRGRLIIPKIAA